MTRSTRNFLVGSAAVVVIGLGTGLLAFYNGGLTLGGSRGVAGDLAYIPADSAAVAYADVHAIMNSQFRHKLRQVLPTGEELVRIKAELGVDIEKDIDTLSAAYLGGTTAESGLVVVRGRFNTQQIEALATQHGAVAEDYKGKRLLTMNVSGRPVTAGGMHQLTEAASGHGMPAVAFLEPGVLGLGEAAAIKKAIDANQSGQDIRKNAELYAMMSEVAGTGNAWVVGRIDSLTSQVGLPTEITEHLPAVNMVAASLHVNGGVSGLLRVEARDDKSAEQLRDVVRGALAAGKLVTGQNPKVESMLNSLQITGSGKSVGLSFAVPAEMLDLVNGVAAAHQLGSGPAAPVKR